MLNERNAKLTALISVSDKKGLVKFARGLIGCGFSLVASGRNADYLNRYRIPATKTSKLTGWPPIMNPQGVKTIHPRIYGGIFVDRSNESHINDMKRFKIVPFDIVVCNFYPFETTVSLKHFRHEDAIRNLDIGGPCMVRAAAKHYSLRTVLVDTKDYPKVLAELRKNGGVSFKTRKNLAVKAFKRCIAYDNSVVSYLKQAKDGM